MGNPRTPRYAAKHEKTQMDKHEDKKESDRTVVDFSKTVDCDFFAEVTLMAALCIMISLVIWIGTFYS
jgi:hypothetical protein